MEHQIALRQFLVKQMKALADLSRSNISYIDMTFQNPSAFCRISRVTVPNDNWKKVIKSHVNWFWHFRNLREVNEKSTLSHLKLPENLARIPHKLWLSSKYSPSASRKAAIKAKTVTITYRLQSKKTKFNKFEVNPTCVLCDGGDKIREHFYLTCKALIQKGSHT